MRYADLYKKVSLVAGRIFSSNPVKESSSVSGKCWLWQVCCFRVKYDHEGGLTIMKIDSIWKRNPSLSLNGEIYSLGLWPEEISLINIR